MNDHENVRYHVFSLSYLLYGHAYVHDRDYDHDDRGHGYVHVHDGHVHAHVYVHAFLFYDHAYVLHVYVPHHDDDAYVQVIKKY